MSNERRPASTCASGTPSLAATSDAGERRVGVPVDEHGVRLVLERGALDPDQHGGRLLGVRARADLEPHVRLAQAELLAEDPRELVVVVLTGVGDDQLDVLDELRVQRSGLDELGPRPGDREQAHRQEGTAAANGRRMTALQYCQRARAGRRWSDGGSAEIHDASQPAPAACSLAGDARDPLAGRRVRAAVDAQLRRAGVEAQDADDVRTEVVLALLCAPAAELPLPLELVCARAAAIARNKAIDHGRRRARAPLALGDALPEPRDAGVRPGLAGGRARRGHAQSAHRRRVRADLVLALDRLDAPQRAAIGAHAEGGAARAAGLPRSTYYRVLAHAQARLAAICAGGSPGIGALGGVVQRAREVFQHVEAVHGAAAAATAAVAVSAAVVLGVHDEGAHPPAARRRRGRSRRARGAAPVAASSARRPSPRAPRRRVTHACIHSRCAARRRAGRGRGYARLELVHVRPILLRLLRDLRPHYAPHRRNRALPACALCTRIRRRGHVRRALRRRRRPCSPRAGRHVPTRGAVCGYEGTGTVFLNAGTLAAHSGCLYLFNAPAAAQILAVNVTLGYAKASAATALCAYSFAAQPGDTLRRCSGGTYTNAVATSGANWVELGLYNEGATPIALATSRANNVVFTSGWVTLCDPDRPGARRHRPDRACRPASPRSCSGRRPTPRAARPSVTYCDRRRRARGMRGQACSWLCGTGDERQLRRSTWARSPTGRIRSPSTRSRTPTPAASVGPMRLHGRPHAAGAARIHVERDAAAPATGWWGHAPDRADGLVADRERRRRLDRARLRALGRARLPASPSPVRVTQPACPPPPSRLRAPTRST